MHTNPSEDELRVILRTVKHIAVVGLSDNPERPSFRVARGLQRHGYHIIPVRPKAGVVLGEPSCASLAEIPGPVDIVDVFRAPEHVGPIVDECLRLGIKRLWLQDGVINEEAAARAVAGGMTVIMNRCMWRDYENFFAGGHAD